MDVLAVREATRAALEQMRRTQGPRFIEFRTYRFRAHSMFDPELYRSREEVEQWKQRCPVAAFTRFVLEARLLSRADVEAIEARVDAGVGEAVQAAEAGTWEPIDDLARHVRAEPPRVAAGETR
jgi:TPP-dependent pyruvate/acetoin dehydrogenase alpha subunit